MLVSACDWESDNRAWWVIKRWFRFQIEEINTSATQIQNVTYIVRIRYVLWVIQEQLNQDKGKINCCTRPTFKIAFKEVISDL